VTNQLPVEQNKELEAFLHFLMLVTYEYVVGQWAGGAQKIAKAGTVLPSCCCKAVDRGRTDVRTPAASPIYTGSTKCQKT
jgi:hypothetical protein